MSSSPPSERRAEQPSSNDRASPPRKRIRSVEGSTMIQNQGQQEVKPKSKIAKEEEMSDLPHEVPLPVSLDSLGQVDREVVRLIGQHLTQLGLRASAEALMQETGCRLDQPNAAKLKKHVLNGNWNAAVKTLEDLKDHLESPDHLVEMKFLLLEQKYLEFLSKLNRIEALKVLQNELTPLSHNRTRTHELSSYLMLSRAEDISRVTRPSMSGGVSTGAPRAELMERLQSFLPPSIMLPPRRLNALLQQAADWQTMRCLYHNKAERDPSLPCLGDLDPDIDPSFLAVDHKCSRDEFPCETIQVLSEHSEEVWYCKFSPDGMRLATGSKDNTAVIWDFDPDTLTVRHARTLERFTHGVSFMAWSPDSSKLAVCGPEDSDEISLWNVESGTLEAKISHSTEDSLSCVAWGPDGKKLACGGVRGNFYQCDTKGIVNDSWEGVRVQGLHYRLDGKSILASDTHHRIRAYNFEELTDYSVLQEDHGIMSFSMDASDRYALLNIANQGIHLWDVDERCLIRKFTGITQGFYVIHSCFGGPLNQKGGQNFVASGSEDNKVYLYHVKQESPIGVLTGHSRTVNCVTWNPVYPSVVASASDDGTVRLWGPREKYRKRKRKMQDENGANGSQNGNGSTNGVV